jgi:hypothetical protein
MVKRAVRAVFIPNHSQRVRKNGNRQTENERELIKKNEGSHLRRK